MKNLNLLIRQLVCLITVVALFCCATLFLPLRAAAQTPDHRGKPVVITFGQPNIWSLDQAHYLLSQLRERSLDFEAERLAKLDPNETHGTRLNFMRQLFELAAQFKQPITGGSPEPSPTQAEIPTGTPEKVASTNVLDGSVLGTLLSNPEFQKKLFSDAKLNAITKLDNHIQLQYEIVARQLTLLRDEVRPGERLVFLELPQSIYTTDDKADNKMAQVWWQVDGYHEYEAEKELTKAIDAARRKIDSVKRRQAEVGVVDEEACKLDVVKTICIEEGKACRDRREQCSVLRELRHWENNLKVLQKRLNDEKAEEESRTVENLMQRGIGDYDRVRNVEGGKFVEVRGTAPVKDRRVVAEYKHAQVRTVDVIPHQSSLNVNDVQETIKSSFITGAFSFLFGLGARTSFQKQRDQFEQFLHQELYASGFGKGDSLFGWTFGPLPGTKRVAPGLRTTFAALVVPEKAESISLTARGCFFHREDNGPPDVMNQKQGSKWWDNNDRECSDAQHYLLPLPSAGGTQNFFVRGIEYVPFKSPGDRMVALIKGDNFSTQVGVLINGVPLKSVVELTRKLPASARYDRNVNCDAICGEYEVIGPNDISIAFEMPNSFVGTPEITVVGPGRAVNLNHLPMTVRPYGLGVFYELDDGDTPFMFGDGPQVRIGEVKLFKETATSTLGLLRGRKLTGTAEIFVNGAKLTSIGPAAFDGGARGAHFDSGKKLFRLRFGNLVEDKVDILIVDGTDADTKVVPNPFAEVKKPPPLAVTEDSVLALDTARSEMAVRLAGTGLAKVTLQVLRGASPDSEITSQSATELILRLVEPKIAVRIKLTDPNTGEELTRAIVRRPPPRSITEKRDVVDVNKN
jgi:hypothetical protein